MEIESEKKVLLDIKIVRKKHQLKVVKSNPRYLFMKEYKTIIEDLKELLKQQKRIDRENFLLNLMSIDEFKDEVIKRKRNKKLFSKLSEIERNFLINEGYNYLTDELNILSKRANSSDVLVTKWKELQIEIYNKNNT